MAAIMDIDGLFVESDPIKARQTIESPLYIRMCHQYQDGGGDAQSASSSFLC